PRKRGTRERRQAARRAWAIDRRPHGHGRRRNGRRHGTRRTRIATDDAPLSPRGINQRRRTEMVTRIAAGNVRIKRAYVQPEPADGTRILVDRLWPRGIAKADA